MKNLFILIAALFIVACSAQLKAPTRLDADRGANRWENYDSLKLAHGFSIYKNKCGGCHNLHLPAQYSEDRWNIIIPKMALKAKLSADQTDLVTKYILVMATAPSVK